MPHRYNEKSLAELKRLKGIATEFLALAEASQNFLNDANKLDEETNSRLRKKADQARFLGAQISDPFAKGLLLELAENFERIAS